MWAKMIWNEKIWKKSTFIKYVRAELGDYQWQWCGVSAENGLRMLQREELKKGIACFAKTTQTQIPIIIMYKPKVKKKHLRGRTHKYSVEKYWNINPSLKNKKLLFKTYRDKVEKPSFLLLAECLNNMFISWKFWTIKTGYVLIHGVQI